VSPGTLAAISTRSLLMKSVGIGNSGEGSSVVRREGETC
jgi:hypothetical protein